MINPPLVSTAVGVVAPARAGMASGVNSTFRQVGIATGIAALGSIFSHQVAAGLQDKLAGTPAAGQSDQIAERRHRWPGRRRHPAGAGRRTPDARGRRDVELRRRAQPHRPDRGR